MKKGLMIIVLVLLVKSSFGQEFTDLYGDYLGQTPPNDTPMIFAPGIISRTSLEHGPAIFSPDGNEVYWMSRESPLNGGTGNLWRMTRINNRWTKPRNLAPFGENVAWMDPFLSKDGKKLYFSADRNEILKNGVSQGKNTENRDIWFIEKQENGWCKPQSISSVINIINGQNQASFTSDGTVYFIDYNWDEKTWTCNIVRSKFKDGNYLHPDTLPACINSPSQDWTPFIARDDSYLIFSSQRQDKYGDLFISFHDIVNDKWSEPINMGEPINTESQESFPTITPDGKYLFFTRWTDDNTDMDIYWVSAKIIDRIREKNNIKK